MGRGGRGGGQGVGGGWAGGGVISTWHFSLHGVARAQGPRLWLCLVLSLQRTNHARCGSFSNLDQYQEILCRSLQQEHSILTFVSQSVSIGRVAVV